jgi:hypothetical protein
MTLDLLTSVIFLFLFLMSGQFVTSSSKNWYFMINATSLSLKKRKLSIFSKIKKRMIFME